MEELPVTEPRLGPPSRKGGQDLQYLRNFNLRALLSAIWDHAPISRFDLASITGLAPSSITRLLQDLRQQGLIVETGRGESSGGRVPALIAPNPDAGLVISLDLSASYLRGGIFDAANTPLRIDTQPYQGLGPENIRAQTLAMIERLRADPAARERPLLGIGVSQPGTIDLENGSIQDCYNLRLHHFPMRQILGEAFGLPVYVEHDASAAAMAEQYYGAGRGLEDLIYILISIGIGSGILVNGQIYRGETGKPGELGHIIVQPGGAMCVCGQRGCLETVAAAPAILSSARWLMAHGRAPLLIELCRGAMERVTIAQVGQAASLGDRVARDLLEHSADYLALGLTIFASLFDIRRIIIGGEVAETGAVFLEPLRRSLDHYRREALEIDLIPAALKQDTFLRGVSMLTLQEVLQSQALRWR